jgi:hypothetical protein
MSFNFSGTIATANQPQQLIPPDPTNQLIGYQVQNTGAGVLYIEDAAGVTASAASLQIPAGATYTSPDGLKLSAGVTIFGATQGATFYAKAY